MEIKVFKFCSVSGREEMRSISYRTRKHNRGKTNVEEQRHQSKVKGKLRKIEKWKRFMITRT